MANGLGKCRETSTFDFFGGFRVDVWISVHVNYHSCWLSLLSCFPKLVAWNSQGLPLSVGIGHWFPVIFRGNQSFSWRCPSARWQVFLLCPGDCCQGTKSLWHCCDWGMLPRKSWVNGWWLDKWFVQINLEWTHTSFPADSHFVFLRDNLSSAVKTINKEVERNICVSVCPFLLFSISHVQHHSVLAPFYIDACWSCTQLLLFHCVPTSKACRDKNFAAAQRYWKQALHVHPSNCWRTYAAIDRLELLMTSVMNHMTTGMHIQVEPKEGRFSE